jgi:hypothetical protein
VYWNSNLAHIYVEFVILPIHRNGFGFGFGLHGLDKLELSLQTISDPHVSSQNAGKCKGVVTRSAPISLQALVFISRYGALAVQAEKAALVLRTPHEAHRAEAIYDVNGSTDFHV